MTDIGFFQYIIHDHLYLFIFVVVIALLLAAFLIYYIITDIPRDECPICNALYPYGYFVNGGKCEHCSFPNYRNSQGRSKQQVEENNKGCLFSILILVLILIYLIII